VLVEGHLDDGGFETHLQGPGRGVAERGAEQECEEELHSRPFACASRMRPPIGAASVPPERVCNRTVTRAVSEKPANQAREAPLGVRTLPVLPASCMPETRARCAVPKSTASAIPA